MFKNVKRWMYGLVSNIISGGANSAGSAITTMIIDPAKFNFADAHGLQNILKAMAVGFCLGSAIHLIGYLQKAPLPEAADETQFFTKSKPSISSDKTKP